MLNFLCNIKSLPWALALVGVAATALLYVAFKVGAFIIRRIKR